MTAERCSAAARSPVSKFHSMETLPAMSNSSWILGAPGARASKGSSTVGSKSYSMSMRSIARWAVAASTAATAATSSPTQRTTRPLSGMLSPP